MQYLLLIYENEKRFSQGYDQAEMGEYQAFGKEFSKNIKGGNALQPTGTAKTVRVRNGKPATPMDRSPKPRNSSGDTTWWKQAVSVRP